jgi:arabinan endo-1,5-alpha-L-arabinosidase
MGMDMLKGGGKLVVGASGRCVGAGHFGLLDLGDGVQKFSCHFEADLDRGGRSVLDIRPLLWKNGWPVAGDNFKEGTYEIQSERSGYALELAVESVVIGGSGRGGPRGGVVGPVTPIPLPDVAEVSKTWPAGAVDIRIGDYMVRPHQKWTISPVAGVALAATEDAELVAVPAFTGVPEQLWRIDQLTDGTYRIMPKAVPNSKEPLALTAVGGSTPTLARFDPKSDKARWNFRTP